MEKKHMKENVKKDKLEKAMECIHMLINLIMMDSGKMIIQMGKEYSYIVMGICIQGALLMV